MTVIVLYLSTSWVIAFETQKRTVTIICQMIPDGKGVTVLAKVLRSGRADCFCTTTAYHHPWIKTSEVLLIKALKKKKLFQILVS